MTDTFKCPIADQHGNPFRYCPFKGCGWHEPIPPADGVSLIAAERRRQIDEEGWTPDHDAEHSDGELRFAAACYAARANNGAHESRNPCPDTWPWDPSWWKPSNDPIRNLVKAGALIAAEIDRLQARP